MTNKKAVEIIETFTANIFTEELEVIKKDLEVLEIIKKYVSHYDPSWSNQAQWNMEEFHFTLESDNMLLSKEKREEHINDFRKFKEWYLKEVEND